MSGPRRFLIGDDCPWPERRGLTAVEVIPTADDAKFYPFAGLGASEVALWIENDPFGDHRPGRWSQNWSCVVSLNLLEQLPSCDRCDDVGYVADHSEDCGTDPNRGVCCYGLGTKPCPACGAPECSLCDAAATWTLSRVITEGGRRSFSCTMVDSQTSHACDEHLLEAFGLARALQGASSDPVNIFAEEIR